MIRAFVFILLLLVSCLTGCLKSPESEGPWDGWSPRFGLGLNITPVPPPGRFLENSADIDRLTVFLETVGREKLRDCRVSDLSGFDSLLQDRYYLAALETILWQCYGQHAQEHDRKALFDHDNGLAETEIHMLLQRGPSDLNASIAVLNGLSWPANSMDLEVLGRAMKLVRWVDAAWTSVPALVADYLEKRERIMIEGLYGNLYIPQKMSPVIEWLAIAFPWSETTCKVNVVELHRLQVRAWSLLNETIAKADRLRPPDEDVNLSTNYGRLTQDFKPSMEFAHHHGWWPLTLWYEFQVAGSSTFWDHRYDAVLPTNEEALFLLASYLNESRNLIADDDIAIMQGNVPYWDFEEYPTVPLLVLAAAPSAAPWTYAKLPCQLVPTNATMKS